MATVNFLGACVTSFNANMGWGTTPTTVEINLVEDTDEDNEGGNLFTRPATGTIATFKIEDFKFDGIIQNWRESRSPAGNPIFTVNLIDPREILEGVQIIVNGYSNKVLGIPNIINVYGYLENKKFGSAQADETGMPWSNIRSALSELTQLDPAGDYGGPIVYRDVRFGLDLSNLPTLPLDYKIGGDTNISVMDYITEVCDAASHDFFFKLEKGLIWFIKIYTISRKKQAQIGKISEFISNNPEYVSADVGLENVNADCGKMLVGGQVHEMYYQTLNGTGQNATIWPYWGLQENGDIILGTGINNEHKFTVYSGHVMIEGMPDYYTMDVGELRAALHSRASWELYLDVYNENKQSIHYQKATRLNIKPTLSAVKFLQQLESGSQSIRLTDVINSMEGSGNSEHENNIQIVYEFVKQYADEYYGKKFMVRIPFVFVATNDDGVVKTSRKPVDSAFISETDWPKAISLNLLPFNVDPLYNEEGKIVAYVKFENANELDFSEVGNDNVILSQDEKTAFIKCKVEPDIVFLTYKNGFSPRAIVELPGQVKRLTGEYSENDFGIIQLLLQQSEKLTGIKPTPTVQQIANSVGTDGFIYGLRGAALLPNAASVPLEDTQKTYGPWTSYGANGHMSFEQDTSLVPWNFGGDYTTLNTVASSRVNEVLANLTTIESGSIEYPGAPVFDMGQQLIDSGPYITNITISVGTDGIKTRYRMEIWTPRYGKLSNFYTNRITKLAQKQNLQRRRNRIALNASMKKAAFNKAIANKYRTGKSRAMSANSTHMFIAGQTQAYKIPASGNTSISGMKTVHSHQIAMLPHYAAKHNIGEDYKDKGACSLDAIFRVFSTDSGANNMPKFEAPKTSGEINIDSLNPFIKNDFGYLIEGDIVKSGLSPSSSGFNHNNIRSIALRGPLIVAGWGYDTDDNPVPGKSGEFLEGYKKDTANWKVGPVDLRWDDNLKLWAAGGGAKFKIGIASSLIRSPLYIPGSGVAATSGLAKIYNSVDSIIKHDNSEINDYVLNIDTSKTITPECIMILTKSNGKYIPIYIGN